jgi:hypothetical protein
MRVEKSSGLGSWSYEPIDTKLAQETKGGTLLQLSLYADLLGRHQDLTPEWVHVVTPETATTSCLGTGSPQLDASACCFDPPKCPLLRPTYTLPRPPSSNWREETSCLPLTPFSCMCDVGAPKRTP